MKLTLHNRIANSISKLTEDSVSINGVTYASSLIVSATTLIETWSHPPLAELDAAALAPALDEAPEVLLIGCGTTQAFLPTHLLATLAGKGVGVEVMTNDAACRTYNVLVSEERPVALALMLGASTR